MNREELVSAPRTAREAPAITRNDNPAELNNQALRLLGNPNTADRVHVLNAAIALLRSAIAATSSDHPDRAAMLSNLGAALDTRFHRTGLAADLDEAIVLGREAATATRAGHPDRAMYRSNLASALLARFERAGAVTDLADAIVALHAALEATPADHPHRAACLSNLANALTDRFERTGAVADLDQAITAIRTAIVATPADHPHRAGRLSNLGNALRLRFERTGVASDLDSAISAGRAAVEATPVGQPNRAMYLSNFANALTDRFEQTGTVADLDHAIAISHEAVTTTPTDHPNRAMYLSNLANTLTVRFERVGTVVDLDHAITVSRQAARATPQGHPHRARHLSNLGNTLRTRFELTGAAIDLDQAVAVGLESIQAAPVDDMNRAMYLSNAGIALLQRFERTGVTMDLDQAIAAIRTATDAIPSDHPDRDMYLSNLGNALRTRFELTGAEADLDQAIIAIRAAAETVPVNQADRAICLSNLGIALLDRFRRGKDPADLDSAVAAIRSAIAATPADHPNQAMYLSNLANGLLVRFHRTGANTDLDETLAALRQGASVATAPPLTRARIGRTWADLAAAHGDRETAREALRGVLELLPHLIDHSLSEADRRHHLEQLQGLGPLAAWSELAAPGDTAAPKVDTAWVALETGRGVLLRQALEARDDVTTLKSDHPEIAERVHDLRRLLNRDLTKGAGLLSGAPGLIMERRHRLAQEWTELLAMVRSLPGHERFSTPPTIEELHAAADGGTIVAVNVTTGGCGALILTSRASGYLPLPDLTEAAAVEHANRFLPSVTPGGAQHSEDVSTVLEWLWDVVAAPILTHLGYTDTPPPGQRWPQVWWILTGSLSFLPIHAAGHHRDPAGTRRSVLDRVVSSYTPTVRSLLRARNRRPTSPGPSGLVVGLDSTKDQDARGLAFAQTEAKQVHRRFVSGTLLLGEQATLDRVDSVLPQADWIHLACHAVADLDDPTRSRLLLYDGQLSVAELNRMDLNRAYLAYLSACSTAVGSQRLTDEAIHIASAFQLAGYAHVIATQWQVSDTLSAAIAWHVYNAIISGSSPAHAVHLAARAMRETYPDRPLVWASHVHFGP